MIEKDTKVLIFPNIGIKLMNGVMLLVYHNQEEFLKNDKS
jgi:hypothetical protein